MKRVCGRLWEVVVYESQTAGSHFRGEAWTHLLFGVNVLHAIFRLHVCKSMFSCLFPRLVLVIIFCVA